MFNRVNLHRLTLDRYRHASPNRKHSKDMSNGEDHSR